MKAVSVIISESLATQFLVMIWVNWDCLHRRNQESAGEVVSVSILEVAATRFSMMISESSVIVCAEESRRQLSKQCRW